MKFSPPFLRKTTQAGAMLAVLLAASVCPARAIERSGLFCFFEDFSDSAGALNSGDAGGVIRFVGESHQVTGVARFGDGALSIQPEGGVNRGGLKVPFSSGELEELSKAQERFTACFWIKSGGKHGGQLIWRIPRNATTPGGFLLGHNRENLLYFMALDAEGKSGRAFSPKVDLPEGEWTHIAFTFELGTVTFYVNGAQLGPVKFTGIKAIPECDSSSSYLSFFHGADAGTLVDDLALFTDSVLLPQEIDAIYTNGLQEYFAQK